MDDLRARVDRMERELRLWRVAGLLLFGAVSLVGVLGAAPARVSGPVADEVRARRFTLVDEYGLVRAVLGDDGGTGLTIFDPRGRPRVRLATSFSGDFPELVFYGKDAKPDVKLEASVWGGGLSLYEPDGARQIRANISGWPAIRVGDQAAKSQRDPIQVIWGLHLFHGDVIRAALSLDPGGLPRLQLYDDNKNVRAALGHIEILLTRSRSVEQRQASSLVLFDEKGNVLWKAP